MSRVLPGAAGAPVREPEAQWSEIKMQEWRLGETLMLDNSKSQYRIGAGTERGSTKRCAGAKISNGSQQGGIVSLY